MKHQFFKTASDFRTWLKSNHGKETELAVGFCKKSSGKPSVTYSEAVDEALCFGWIDGVRNSIDAHTYRVRFTPRKPKSQWSAVNVNRVQKLIEQRKMAPAGLAAFAGEEAQTRTYSYEQRNTAKFDAANERRFRANKIAWDFFRRSRPGIAGPLLFGSSAPKNQRLRTSDWIS